MNRRENENVYFENRTNKVAGFQICCKFMINNSLCHLNDKAIMGTIVGGKVFIAFFVNWHYIGSDPVSG